MSDVYPEHAKMTAVQTESQAIGSFLETSGYVLAQWAEDTGGRDVLVPVVASTEMVLAHYFEIDLAKVEAEKREMLRRLREANGS